MKLIASPLDTPEDIGAITGIVLRVSPQELFPNGDSEFIRKYHEVAAGSIALYTKEALKIIGADEREKGRFLHRQGRWLWWLRVLGECVRSFDARGEYREGNAMLAVAHLEGELKCFRETLTLNRKQERPYNLPFPQGRILPGPHHG